jgi:hypothetical protein
MAVRLLPAAPRTRAEQFQFLRDAHDGPLEWHALCLSLARQAPGLPGGIPSAHAAALMTPQAHRVHDVSKLRRGMVIYYADFNDDNPFDHVDTMAGWHTPSPTHDLHDTATWTNDIVRDGGVDLVRGDLVPQEWGDPFWFGAISLSGFMLPGYEDPRAPQPTPLTIGQNLDDAIMAVRRGIRFHRREEHPKRVAALVKDLTELQETRKQFPRP